MANAQLGCAAGNLISLHVPPLFKSVRHICFTMPLHWRLAYFTTQTFRILKIKFRGLQNNRKCDFFFAFLCFSFYSFHFYNFGIALRMTLCPPLSQIVASPHERRTHSRPSNRMKPLLENKSLLIRLRNCKVLFKKKMHILALKCFSIFIVL